MANMLAGRRTTYSTLGGAPRVLQPVAPQVAPTSGRTGVYNTLQQPSALQRATTSPAAIGMMTQQASQQAATAPRVAATPAYSAGYAGPTDRVAQGAYAGPTDRVAQGAYAGPTSRVGPAWGEAAYGGPTNRLAVNWDYQSSPEYQWRLQEAQKALQRQLGSRGRLDSTYGYDILGRQANQIAGEEVDKQYQRALGAEATNYGRGFQEEGIAYGRGVDLGERQLNRENINYGRGVGEEATGYQRGLESNQINYGRGVSEEATGYQRGLESNQINYGRGTAEDLARYQRGLTQNQENYSRYLNANQINYGRGWGEEERGYGRAWNEDERAYGRQFQAGEQDWMRNMQLANLAFQASNPQYGASYGNALGNLYSDQGRSQAGIAQSQGAVQGNLLQSLLNSGYTYLQAQEMMRQMPQGQGGGQMQLGGYQTPGSGAGPGYVPPMQAPNMAGVGGPSPGQYQASQFNPQVGQIGQYGNPVNYDPYMSQYGGLPGAGKRPPTEQIDVTLRF